MALRLSLLSLLFLIPANLRADDADPEYGGRKRSEWETMLKTEQNARLRRVAVVSLGNIVSERVTDAKLIKESDAKLLKEVIQLIGRTLKTDSVASVRLAAAGVCSLLAVKLLDSKSDAGPFLVLDLAENLRVEKEPDVRKEVATALGLFGKAAKSADTALMGILKDKDAGVREAGATALGRIGSDAKAAAPELIPLLVDPEKAVRIAAVFALGRVAPVDTEKASAALIPLLKDRTDPMLRKEAVISLGLICHKTPGNVQALAAGLADPDIEVRRQTAQALGRFVGALKVVELELKKSIVEDEDKETRAHALRALCDGFGEQAKDLLPFLVMRLGEEKDFDIKLAIISELGDLGNDGKAAVPALRLAMKDPQVKIREAASYAIKRIEKPVPKPMPPMPEKPMEEPKKPVEEPKK